MSHPFPLFLKVVLPFAAASAVSGAVSLDGLVSESPFMPKQESRLAPVVTEGAMVEFRGMITTQDGVLFGLYDRTRNLGAWVRQEDAGADFKVSAYDTAKELVTVSYQGQQFTLPLSVSKIAAAAPSAMPVVNAQPAGGAPVRVTAQPGGARIDDQQRLESVAAEVRRRRALRQAAATGNTAPAQTTGGARQ